MKKTSLLLCPLMAISFLVNCGGSTPPTPEDVYHIVTFESNGGTHINTQKVLDGKTVTPPEDPTSEYGSFMGWFKDAECQFYYDFDTPVTDDLVLYANWDTTVNFTFVGEHCTIEGKDNFVKTYDYGEYVSFKIDAESVGYSIEDHIEFTINDIESSDYNYDPRTQIFSTSCKGDAFLKISSEKMLATTVQLDTPDGLTSDYIINFSYTIENDDGPFFVDWGDGVVDSSSIHPYLVSTKDPIITIYGNISKLAFADEQGLYATFNTLVSEINLANSVNMIPDYAFRGCTGLKTINLAQTEIIGNEAFSGCTSLTNISTPNKMTSIGERAFKGCNNITAFTFPTITAEEDHPENKKISKETFLDCSKLNNITIPDDITIIEEYAFSGCSSLSSVKLPTKMFSVGKGAFKGTALKTFAFPSIDGEYDKAVREETFMDCNSLESIEIPSDITTIKADAFRRCSNLGSVILYGITKVESPAFSGCAKLKLYCVNEYTEQFYFSNAAETAIEGESPAIMVKFSCLDECVDTTGNYSCLVNETESGEKQITILKYISETTPETLTIPDKLTITGYGELPVVEIGYQAFAFRPIYNVDFRTNPKVKLDTEAFAACFIQDFTWDDDYATRVTKGYDLSFGDRAFASSQFYFPGKILIPLDAVTHMGSAVFDESVEDIPLRKVSITCENEEEPANWNKDWNVTPSARGRAYPVNYGNIENCDDKSGVYNIDLLLDNSATRATKTEQYGISICKFLDESSTPGTWTVPNELTATYTKVGEERTYKVQRIGKLTGAANITKVIFNNDLVKIDNNAFEGLPIKTLDFTSNSMLQNIGDSAFNQCDNLTGADMHNLQHLTRIGAGSFQFCDNLRSVYLPSSIKRIENAAFAYSRQLSSLQIDGDNQVEFIGNNAFISCSLQSNKLTFNQVKTIGESAFCSTNISEITLLGIETLSWGSLDGADNLTKITLGPAFKKFDNRAAHAATEIDLSQVTAVPVGTSQNAKITDKTTCVIKVPSSLLSDFQNSPYWKDLNIVSA